jgi:hypothetical protein
MFRHGWALGWILAIVAELAVMSLIVESILFGLFLGLAAIVPVAVGTWIAANLFRADVLRFFFHRRAVTVAPDRP